MDLCRNFAVDTSRNAAYRTLAWIEHLPHIAPDDLADLLATQFAYQLERQARGTPEGAAERARKLATLVVEEAPTHHERVALLKNLLVTAEFLAREGRIAEARAS
jgi:hypothetical protein